MSERLTERVLQDIEHAQAMGDPWMVSYVAEHLPALLAEVRELRAANDALHARLEKLFVYSPGGFGSPGSAMIPGEVFAEKNEELLARCNVLQGRLNNIVATASIRLASGIHTADAYHWREVLSLARGEVNEQQLHT